MGLVWRWAAAVEGPGDAEGEVWRGIVVRTGGGEAVRGIVGRVRNSRTGRGSLAGRVGEEEAVGQGTVVPTVRLQTLARLV